MLRGVGRHAKQALLIPVNVKRNEHILTPHSQCSLHALALPKHHAVTLFRPLTCPEVPRAPRPRILVRCRGQFPSGILDIIDTLSAATREEITTIVSDVNASFKLRRYFRQRESARRLAQFLASTSRPSRACSVMTLAHALGCRFKPNHFESVLHQLSLREHWSLIPPLVSLARDQCGKTTARLLNWKIRAFIECHRFGRLDHVIEEFARDKVQPTRRTFHLLVSGHLRNQDLDSAKRCLQLMEKAGFSVDATTHALIVTAYRSLGLDPQVHARAIEALCHVDVRTSTRVLNSVVQHFLDVGDERSATEYINRMISPVTPRSETAHQLGGTTTELDGAASSLIDSLPPSSGRTLITHHPDAATFTILIHYLNSQRQFHRIHNVVNRMVEIGTTPDVGVVAALIRTYCLSGRDDMAMSLLAAMLKSDTDAQSVLALLRVNGISQLPIDVKGIGLTVHVFNAVLPRVMEIRGLGGARIIIRIMQSNGIQSNAATIEVFLNYLSRIGHIKTRRLSQVLQRMSRRIHGPTIRHLNAILRNVLHREKFRVHGIGWDTAAARFSPTRRYTFVTPENRTILASENFDPSGSHHHSHSLDIRSTILTLSRKGVKSDRATFAMWLKHECIADPTLETAKSVFHHMIDKGMHPNRHHFTSLMDGFTRAGDMQTAERVMRSAKVAGFEPDVVMWTVLISGYGRKGEPELAMRAFRAMVTAGIPPDVPAIDALAHAYFAVGAYSVARKVLLELWPQVKPFPSELKNAPLKQLARIFRGSGNAGAPWKKSLTLRERRSFNQELLQVLLEWKEI